MLYISYTIYKDIYGRYWLTPTPRISFYPVRELKKKNKVGADANGANDGDGVQGTPPTGTEPQQGVKSDKSDTLIRAYVRN